MARIADVLRHPVVYAGRARWKLGHFRRSLRSAWGSVPAWRRAMNKRLEVVDYGPLYIFLESASPCNLKCPMCPTGLGQVDRPPGFLGTALAEKLAGEIRHKPEYVGLWLAGEPLMNRELAECIRIFRRRDFTVRLHTNATLLTEKKSRELIESGLNWISFSFDGFDPETYAKLRRGGNYEKTLDNLMTFLRLKREMRSATPFTVIQMVQPFEGWEKHPYGFHPETPANVRKLFEGLPVDHFETILAHGWAGQIEGEAITPNMTGVGQRTSCRIPYTDITFTWNGDAVSCCGDLNAANVFGNLRERSLEDIWNGPEYQKFRRDMHTAAVESRPLCGTCERIWTKPHRNDYQLRLQELRYRLRF
ncbi:SPASM domain-containing protein [Candidatus Poribacteria bacterium]|nr:SPASM domain-containing protein [Candidatus Poribacteria bacterium]